MTDSTQEKLKDVFYETLKPYVDGLQPSDVTIEHFPIEVDSDKIEKALSIRMNTGRDVNPAAQTLVRFNNKVSLELMRALKQSVSDNTRLFATCDENGLYIHDTAQNLSARMDGSVIRQSVQTRRKQRPFLV